MKDEKLESLVDECGEAVFDGCKLEKSFADYYSNCHIYVEAKAALFEYIESEYVRKLYSQ